MTANIQTDPRSNLIGSAWMIAAMAGFALEDALLKAASVALPIWQVLVLFGAGGAAVFACVAGLRGTPLLQPDVLSRPMKIRVLFEILGRLFYVLAIALTPLSSATVILQATPLVVVAGAALFFWRNRWLAKMGRNLCGNDRCHSHHSAHRRQFFDSIDSRIAWDAWLCRARSGQPSCPRHSRNRGAGVFMVSSQLSSPGSLTGSGKAHRWHRCRSTRAFTCPARLSLAQSLMHRL